MNTRRINLPFSVKKPILACGADLKGAFALAEGKNCILADSFGDLSDLDNFTEYALAVRACTKKTGIKPQVITCDLHPNYFSVHFAEDLQLKSSGLKICRIQHHEAHIASVITDNKIKGDVIGVAFDGTGYGTDGNMWGGEFFAGGLNGFKRAAHLEYIPMPGADMAVKEPWRMAASYINNAFGNTLPSIVRRWNSADLKVIKAMISKRVNSPLTSGAGRLFDAAASIILSKDRIRYEAELPIELEKALTVNSGERYGFDIERAGGNFIIKTSVLIKDIVKDAEAGTDKGLMSCKFHNTVAEMIVETSARLGKKFKIEQVVLSGGVFQNKYVTARALNGLRDKGFKAYSHRDVPASDYGIPVGQIAMANKRAICV
ncbi:MAG: hypothetical protein WCY36_03875 [Candidatus Omnitrophota bacterium]